MVKATTFSIFADNNNLAITINIPNTLDLISTVYKINNSDMFKELKDIIMSKIGLEYAKF
jgi:hypothetical protein